MDTSAAGPLVASPGAGPDAALAGVPSGPGWLALRDCPLGGDGPPVALALLHPKIGVALVDFAATQPDPADRLRRALEARRFPAIFGGFPPVARVVLPPDRLPELGHVLATRFAAEPRFALEGDDAWLPTARAALEAGRAAADPAPPRGARRRDVPPWRAAVLILGAAASGAALAAVAVMPAARGPLNAAFEPAPAAPKPPDPPLPWPAPASERATAPDLAAPRPEPAPIDPDAGAEAFAAVPQGAESGRAPSLVPATDQNPPATPSEAPPVPVAPPAAGLPADRPWHPAPLAAPGPDQAGATEETPPASTPTPPTRSAGAAPPPRTAPRSPAGAAAATAPAGDTPGGKRCRDILVKTTLGEGLNNGDKDFMRRGCQRPPD